MASQKRTPRPKAEGAKGFRDYFRWRKSRSAPRCLHKIAAGSSFIATGLNALERLGRGDGWQALGQVPSRCGPPNEGLFWRRQEACRRPTSPATGWPLRYDLDRTAGAGLCQHRKRSAPRPNTPLCAWDRLAQRKAGFGAGSASFFVRCRYCRGTFPLQSGWRRSCAMLGGSF